MKNKINQYSKNEHGFTIVELLIVIVVIAILAAITIIAYNGISSRARTASSQQTANNLVKKAQAYYTINYAYPSTVALFEAGTNEAALDAATIASLIFSAPTAGTYTQVQWRYCDAGAGGQLVYWNTTTGAPVTLTVGTQVSCASVAS